MTADQAQNSEDCIELMVQAHALFYQSVGIECTDALREQYRGALRSLIDLACAEYIAQVSAGMRQVQAAMR